jgi:hypothetical protein
MVNASEGQYRGLSKAWRSMLLYAASVERTFCLHRGIAALEVLVQDGKGQV